MFSGSKYPTSNLHLRKTWSIRGLSEEEAANDDENVKTLTIEMRKKYLKY